VPAQANLCGLCGYFKDKSIEATPHGNWNWNIPQTGSCIESKTTPRPKKTWKRWRTDASRTNHREILTKQAMSEGHVIHASASTREERDVRTLSPAVKDLIRKELVDQIWVKISFYSYLSDGSTWDVHAYARIYAKHSFVSIIMS
jgi:hypothetical protein